MINEWINKWIKWNRTTIFKQLICLSHNQRRPNMHDESPPCLPNLNLAAKNRNANNNNILYYCVDQVLWWVLMGTKMQGKQAS